MIVITAFLAAGVYVFKPISGSINALSKSQPCDEPFLLAVGDIDSRFALSDDDIKNAIHSAAGLWNSGSERELLTYRENGQEQEEADIIINFVYDERQERTDRELRFRERIRSEQSRIDRLREANESERQRFDQRSGEYLKLAEQTTTELNNLNAWVSEKNEEGGLTEWEHDQFQQRKAEIEELQAKVLTERENLDRKAQTINRDTDLLNEKFARNNQLIDQYNDEFAGDMRFTKATYQRLPGHGIITVNQFMNRSELLLILAHEMGHALGIDHLSNPESVMFSQMGEQQLFPEVQLSENDVRAVQKICN